MHDISKLLAAFDALIKRGHTIVVVEHNMDVIKCADWVIDLGPEAGDKGGQIVFEGTPHDLERCPQSYTGQFLTRTHRTAGSHDAPVDVPAPQEPSARKSKQKPNR